MIETIIINSVLTILISGGVFTIYLKYFASKSLEYYKKEYQKELQDYNLYISKRNEIYQESYSLLMNTYTHLPSYSGTYNYPDFNGLDLEGVKRIFDKCFEKKDYHIPEILPSIKVLNAIFYQLYCKQKYNDFSNYVLKNAIYFDSEIEKKVEKVRELLFQLVNIFGEIRVKNGGTSNIDEDYAKEGVIRETIEIKMGELKDKIRTTIFNK